MTDNDVISAIGRDAAVVQANMEVGADGVARKPSPAALKSLARVSMRLALAEIAMDPANARKLFAESYDLTATSGTTEYALKSNTARVISIRRGSDDEPLRPFDDLAHFDRWYASHYGGVTISSSTAPVGYYMSGHTPQRVPKITFVPGIGSETTMKVRREKEPPSPLTTNVIPDAYHDAVVLGGIHFASGGKYAEAWTRMKVVLRAAIDVVVGGAGEIQKSESVRRIVRRHNLLVSSGRSLSTLQLKTLD